VLIAENYALLRERLVQLLAELGERVQVVGLAEDVPRALELFEQLRPDAVILDLVMPGGNGMQVLEHIKQRRPACVVIVLTNYATAPFRDRCRQLGADFFFSKSAEFEKVPKVLEELSNAATPPPARAGSLSFA
jgi:DNA-binding NarL/FixJ family response regulator